jgi:branched-chain amino acid transport system substrate-binding protein
MILTILPVVMSLILGCAEDRAKEPIKIGVVSPLTGRQAKVGKMQKNSYDLAVEEINATGGINGRQIMLIYEDDMDKPEVSSSAVEKLITKDKVLAVMGPYSSSATLPATATGEKYETPFLSPSGANDDITRRGFKWVFRINAPSSVYSKTIFQFLDDLAKPNTIAILFEDSSFGTGVAEAAKQLVEEKGIEVFANESYSRGTPNFRPILTKVKEKSPDVLFMVAYLSDCISLMHQIRELDINPKIFVGAGGGFTMPELVESLGETAEYITAVAQWSESADWPGAKEFYEKYSEKYGSAPDFHGAACYAAAYVMADALKRAVSLNKAEIRNALSATDMMTVFGPVKFEEYEGFTNQNRHQMLMLQVQSGKHLTLWPEEYATAKLIFPTPAWSER